MCFTKSKDQKSHIILTSYILNPLKLRHPVGFFFFFFLLCFSLFVVTFLTSTWISRKVDYSYVGSSPHMTSAHLDHERNRRTQTSPIGTRRVSRVTLNTNFYVWNNMFDWGSGYGLWNQGLVFWILTNKTPDLTNVFPDVVRGGSQTSGTHQWRAWLRPEHWTKTVTLFSFIYIS